MHIINQEEMKYLSFPDYDVEKMEYLPEQKFLKIFVQGGWLETRENEEPRFGKGILFFSSWGSLIIRRYDKNLGRNVEEKELPIDPLKDLCEVIFSDSNAILRGHSKKIGYWMEWEMTNVKMHAEFDGYVEDLDWKPKTSR
mgnify:CR=1 FL=1